MDLVESCFARHRGCCRIFFFNNLPLTCNEYRTSKEATHLLGKEALKPRQTVVIVYILPNKLKTREIWYEPLELATILYSYYVLLSDAKKDAQKHGKVSTGMKNRFISLRNPIDAQKYGKVSAFQLHSTQQVRTCSCVAIASRIQNSRFIANNRFPQTVSNHC